MPKLTIGKNEYNVVEKEISQSSLFFYPENPRIYSLLNINGDDIPDQAEIEQLLISMEHVKQLKLSIESNGGLIDPLIVRDGDFVVLEGNSRLAAYRLLARTDPIRWGKVKCKVLPSDISDSVVFTLLGQYHIIGRKDWEPFEQAGYLYRRHKQTKFPIETMAAELGITKAAAKSFIDTYQFMIDSNDLVPKHWSHYAEYLKSTAIKKARVEHPKLDETIVSMIRNEEITDSKDIRKLGEMAKQEDKKSKKTFMKVAEGELNFYDAYDSMKNAGKFDDIKKRIEKIRTEVTSDDFKDGVLNYENRNEMKYDIKKIYKAIGSLKDELDKDE